MAYTYSIDQNTSVVFISVDGPMNKNDALQLISAFTSDKFFQVDFNICFDIRNTNYFPPYSEVSSFYFEYREHFHHKIKGKVAMIVKGKLQYGIARMSSTIFSAINLNMDVFQTKEEALTWFFVRG